MGHGHLEVASPLQRTAAAQGVNAATAPSLEEQQSGWGRRRRRDRTPYSLLRPNSIERARGGLVVVLRRNPARGANSVGDADLINQALKESLIAVGESEAADQHVLSA